MNYFLILVILILCGGAYYQHTQDQQQIASLQAQLSGQPPMTATATDNTTPSAPNTSTPNAAQPAAQLLAPAPVHSQPPVVAVLPPDTSRSSAIDSAAAAATAAANSNSLGTIKTLDGRTFDDCRVLKIESDGITFNHADGITKVLYPLLPPDIQKKFGYDPQAAVAQTAAQAKYDQEAQQVAAPVTNSTPNP